jgi:hypothetical protein
MRSPTFVGLVFLSCLSVVACGGGSGSTPGASTPTSGGATASDPSIPKPPDHPDSDKVTWKKDSPGKACRSTTKAAGDLSAALNGIAGGCIDKKMHLVGQITPGQGQETGGNMVTTLPLKAQANHCYRVVGLAEPTVTDLDIAVMDSAGKLAGEDLNDSNDAIVMEESAICFKQDDAANVNVAVAKGQGKWAVGIWSD